MVLNRAASLYLALVGICVAAQFTVWTIYAQSSDTANDAATTIWNLLGWCQLAGLAIVLVSTCYAKRRHDADGSSGTRQWLAANVLF